MCFANFGTVENEISRSSALDDLLSFGDQDTDTSVANLQGESLEIIGNSWKHIEKETTITEDTVLEVTVDLRAQGEIYAIGFEVDDKPSQKFFFQLGGTQSWGRQDFANIAEVGNGPVTLSIPVGEYFTGDFTKIVFVADDDASASANIVFSDLVIQSESDSSDGGNSDVVPDDQDQPEQVIVLEPEPVTVPEPEPEPVTVPEPEPDSESTTAVSADDVTAIEAGRVTTLELGDTVSSVRILDKPDVGSLTINPDNTLALVLTGTDYDGPLSFSYEVTYTDGTTEVVDKDVTVNALQQLKGWATGESSYMLETDENGDLIIEHGDEHREVYVSGDDYAISRADIAALHGVEEDDIDGEWLMDFPEYGSNPDMALDQEMGGELWKALAPTGGSNWLLLERGYEYDFPLLPGNAGSESELHPLYIGGYGTGASPTITNEVIQQFTTGNIVIDGIDFDNGIFIANTNNLILNDAVVDGHMLGFQTTSSAREMEGLTLRDSTIYDAVADAPKNSAWGDSDRIQGLFARNVEGLVIEGVTFDHNGWGEGFKADGDPDYGQAPSKMSHNVYLQFSNEDITFRDNIVMRGASFGAQVRPGGFIEDNVFIDNNAAVGAFGGERLDDGTYDGHFSLLNGNVVTSGAAKQIDQTGALTWGLRANGYDSLVDNIVVHLADPNNPDEYAAKVGNGEAVKLPNGAYYDDTIVYNWIAQNFSPTRAAINADRNIGGLDTDQLDDATIQNFTAALLNDPDATIDDLGQYLRDQVQDDSLDPVTADEINDYFQDAFGISNDMRFSAETLRFVPNDLGDGVRWDSRINWSTEDLPGTVQGDNVDLGGNWVTFATQTTEIEDIDLGSGGRLGIHSGKLTVNGDTTAGTDGAEIDIDGSGQLWMNGYTDTDLLDVDIESGRFANTGEISGRADITVEGGQAILATSGANMTLETGSRLTLVGDRADVGFDGSDGGMATLQVDGGRIDFIADADGFSEIGEFRSGALGDTDVQSGIDMGNGILGIDVSDLGDGAFQDTLFSADEIVGNFDTIELVGLNNDRDATISFDYDTDEVTFALTAAGDGTGEINVAFTGDMMNADDGGDLWAALTDGQGTYSETKSPEVEELEEFTALFA